MRDSGGITWCLRSAGITLIASGFLFGGMSLATAQDEASAEDSEELVITARKRSVSETAQDVPLSVSLFSSDKLDSLLARDLKSLSGVAPNVLLEDVGTVRGIANFTIRGQGINSSIPSIDPTVGVFVDGVYIGITAGVLNDFFDMEAVEILRGPQGLLFGRNVTGGAVMLRHRKPTDEFEFSMRGDVGAGPEMVRAMTVSGPLIPGTLNGRLAVYSSDDDGWHTNLHDGNDDFGGYDVTLVRPSLTWHISDESELNMQFERGQSDADGPTAQNLGLYSPNSFDFAVDQEGFSHSYWTQAIAEFTRDVALGNGTITNIFGWRRYTSDALSDVDSSDISILHGYGAIDQEQFSNEFRYFGSFFEDTVDITAGLYWFDQDLDYHERRVIQEDPHYKPARGVVVGVDQAIAAEAETGTIGLLGGEMAFGAVLAALNNIKMAKMQDPIGKPTNTREWLTLLTDPDLQTLLPQLPLPPEQLPALTQSLQAQIAQLTALDGLLTHSGGIAQQRNSWVDATLGGTQDQTTRGAFMSADVHLTDAFTLSLGARYTYEKKEAGIAAFNNDIYTDGATPGDDPERFTVGGLYYAPSLCDYGARSCNYSFTETQSWDNWTPRIGLQYRPTDDMNVYASWSKGFRSGGYNFRHTDPDNDPSAHNEERQDSYEIGVKASWFDGGLTTNVAVFRSEVTNMQRELSRQHPVAVVVQRILNTADATFEGIEFDARARLTENLSMNVAVGYTDGEYDNILYDLNLDNVIDDKDLALDIPRMVPLTFSLGLQHNKQLTGFGGGLLTSRLDFSHRDKAEANETNEGILRQVDLLQASLTYTSADGRLQLSLFGKNLLDEVANGGVSNFYPNFPGGQCPGNPSSTCGVIDPRTNLPLVTLPQYQGSGATFEPITNKGRRWGARVIYRY